MSAAVVVGVVGAGVVVVVVVVVGVAVVVGSAADPAPLFPLLALPLLPLLAPPTVRGNESVKLSLINQWFLGLPVTLQ